MREAGDLAIASGDVGVEVVSVTATVLQIILVSLALILTGAVWSNFVVGYVDEVVVYADQGRAFLYTEIYQPGLRPLLDLARKLINPLICWYNAASMFTYTYLVDGVLDIAFECVELNVLINRLYDVVLAFNDEVIFNWLLTAKIIDQPIVTEELGPAWVAFWAAWKETLDCFCEDIGDLLDCQLVIPLFLIFPPLQGPLLLGSYQIGTIEFYNGFLAAWNAVIGLVQAVLDLLQQILLLLTGFPATRPNFRPAFNQAIIAVEWFVRSYEITITRCWNRFIPVPYDFNGMLCVVSRASMIILEAASNILDIIFHFDLVVQYPSDNWWGQFVSERIIPWHAMFIFLRVPQFQYINGQVYDYYVNEIGLPEDVSDLRLADCVCNVLRFVFCDPSLENTPCFTGDPVINPITDTAFNLNFICCFTYEAIRLILDALSGFVVFTLYLNNAADFFFFVDRIAYDDILDTLVLDAARLIECIGGLFPIFPGDAYPCFKGALRTAALFLGRLITFALKLGTSVITAIYYAIVGGENFLITPRRAIDEWHLTVGILHSNFSPETFNNYASCFINTIIYIPPFPCVTCTRGCYTLPLEGTYDPDNDIYPTIIDQDPAEDDVGIETVIDPTFSVFRGESKSECVVPIGGQWYENDDGNIVPIEPGQFERLSFLGDDQDAFVDPSRRLESPRKMKMAYNQWKVNHLNAKEQYELHRDSRFNPRVEYFNKDERYYPREAIMPLTQPAPREQDPSLVFDFMHSERFFSHLPFITNILNNDYGGEIESEIRRVTNFTQYKLHERYTTVFRKRRENPSNYTLLLNERYNSPCSPLTGDPVNPDPPQPCLNVYCAPFSFTKLAVETVNFAANFIDAFVHTENATFPYFVDRLPFPPEDNNIIEAPNFLNDVFTLLNNLINPFRCACKAVEIIWVFDDLNPFSTELDLCCPLVSSVEILIDIILLIVNFIEGLASGGNTEFVIPGDPMSGELPKFPYFTQGQFSRDIDGLIDETIIAAQCIGDIVGALFPLPGIGCLVERAWTALAETIRVILQVVVNITLGFTDYGQLYWQDAGGDVTKTGFYKDVDAVIFALFGTRDLEFSDEEPLCGYVGFEGGINECLCCLVNFLIPARPNPLEWPGPDNPQILDICCLLSELFLTLGDIIRFALSILISLWQPWGPRGNLNKAPNAFIDGLFCDETDPLDTACFKLNPILEGAVNIITKCPCSLFVYLDELFGADCFCGGQDSDGVAAGQPEQGFFGAIRYFLLNTLYFVTRFVRLAWSGDYWNPPGSNWVQEEFVPITYGVCSLISSPFCIIQLVVDLIFGSESGISECVYWGRQAAESFAAWTLEAIVRVLELFVGIFSLFGGGNCGLYDEVVASEDDDYTTEQIQKNPGQLKIDCISFAVVMLVGFPLDALLADSTILGEQFDADKFESAFQTPNPEDVFAFCQDPEGNAEGLAQDGVITAILRIIRCILGNVIGKAIYYLQVLLTWTWQLARKIINVLVAIVSFFFALFSGPAGDDKCDCHNEEDSEGFPFSGSWHNSKNGVVNTIGDCAVEDRTGKYALCYELKSVTINQSFDDDGALVCEWVEYSTTRPRKPRSGCNIGIIRAFFNIFRAIKNIFRPGIIKPTDPVFQNKRSPIKREDFYDEEDPAVVFDASDEILDYAMGWDDSSCMYDPVTCICSNMPETVIEDDLCVWHPDLHDYTPHTLTDTDVLSFMAELYNGYSPCDHLIRYDAENEPRNWQTDVPESEKYNFGECVVKRIVGERMHFMDSNVPQDIFYNHYGLLKLRDNIMQSADQTHSSARTFNQKRCEAKRDQRKRNSPRKEKLHSRLDSIGFDRFPNVRQRLARLSEINDYVTQSSAWKRSWATPVREWSFYNLMEDYQSSEHWEADVYTRYTRMMEHAWDLGSHLWEGNSALFSVAKREIQNFVSKRQDGNTDINVVPLNPNYTDKKNDEEEDDGSWAYYYNNGLLGGGFGGTIKEYEESRLNGPPKTLAQVTSSLVNSLGGWDYSWDHLWDVMSPNSLGVWGNVTQGINNFSNHLYNVQQHHRRNEDPALFTAYSWDTALSWEHNPLLKWWATTKYVPWSEPDPVENPELHERYTEFWYERNATVAHNWERASDTISRIYYLVNWREIDENTVRAFIINGSCRLMDELIKTGSRLVNYCLDVFVAQLNPEGKRSESVERLQEITSYYGSITETTYHNKRDDVEWVEQSTLSENEYSWLKLNQDHPRQRKMRSEDPTVKYANVEPKQWRRAVLEWNSFFEPQFSIKDKMIEVVEALVGVDVGMKIDLWIMKVEQWFANTNTDPADAPDGVGFLYWAEFLFVCRWPQNVDCSIGVGLSAELVYEVTYWYVVIVLVTLLFFPSITSWVLLFGAVVVYAIILPAIAWHFSPRCWIISPFIAGGAEGSTAWQLFPLPLGMPAVPMCIADEVIALLDDLLRCLDWLFSPLVATNIEEVCSDTSGEGDLQFVDCVNDVGIYGGMGVLTYVGVIIFGSPFVSFMLWLDYYILRNFSQLSFVSAQIESTLDAIVGSPESDILSADKKWCAVISLPSLLFEPLVFFIALYAIARIGWALVVFSGRVALFSRAVLVEEEEDNEY